MRNLIFLAGLVLCAPSRLRAEERTIYGPDGRMDFYQVTDPVERGVMDSAVSLVKSTVSFAFNGEYYRCGGRILGTPARMICPGERFFDQRSIAFCSGTLIAPDLVLTAGHCMDTPDGEPDRCSVTKLVFGYSMKDEGVQPAKIPASEVYSCVGNALYGHAYGEDYAVLRLDRPVAGHRPAAADFEPVQAGTGIFSVGGPYGLPLKVLDGAKVLSVDAKGGYMTTNLDSSGGNSGGGVFSAVTGRLVGLHVASRDEDLVDGPLPAYHGLPDTDPRVLSGTCKRAARYAEEGGRGKRAVLLQAIPGLAALLNGGRAVGVAAGVEPVDLLPAPDKVLELGALLR